MSIAAASSPSRGGIGGMPVMLSLSGFWLLSIVNGAPNDFSPDDLLLLGILAAAVLSAQVAFCFLLRKSRLANWAAAFFSVINIACCYLVFWTPFAALSAAAQIAILVAAVAAAFFFYSFLDDSKTARRTATAAAACLFFYQAAVFAIGEQPAVPEKESPPPGMTSHSDIRLVKFKKFPNVYALSFDGLIPRSLAEKYMQIGELPYQDYMEENDFHMFRNFFADAVYTEKSLANFLGLGTERFRTGDSESFETYGAYAGAFTGQFRSPLVEIFQANGYTANSYASNHFFGDHKGPHMDYYRIGIPFSACSFFTGTAVHLGFWGFCPILSSLLTSSVIGLADIYKKEPGEWLREEFSKALASQRRSFFITYVLTPGHVAHFYNHNHSGQREFYKKLFNEEKRKAALHLQTLLEFVRDNDPDALVFVFGDHGAKLTTGRLWEAQKSEEDRAFFIQDRYGVLGGVYPKDACLEWRELGVYVTPAKVGRAIVRCLSGEDPFIRPLSYALDDDYWGHTSAFPLRYEDYLYE